MSPSSSFSMSTSSSQGSLSPNRDEGIYSGVSTSPVHFLLGGDTDLSRDGNDLDDKEKESVENKVGIVLRCKCSLRLWPIRLHFFQCYRIKTRIMYI